MRYTIPVSLRYWKRHFIIGGVCDDDMSTDKDKVALNARSENTLQLWALVVVAVWPRPNFRLKNIWLYIRDGIIIELIINNYIIIMSHNTKTWLTSVFPIVLVKRLEPKFFNPAFCFVSTKCHCTCLWLALYGASSKYAPPLLNASQTFVSPLPTPYYHLPLTVNSQ